MSDDQRPTRIRAEAFIAEHTLRSWRSVRKGLHFYLGYLGDVTLRSFQIEPLENPKGWYLVSAMIKEKN